MKTKSGSAKENPLVSMLVNIILPTLILTKMSDFSSTEGKFYHVGPVWALILAVIFPVAYGISFFIKVKKFNFFSVVGLISVMLTGVLGLMKASAMWIMIKESTMPTIFGFAILFSPRFGEPLIKKLLLNEQLLNIDLVNKRLEENDNVHRYDELVLRTNKVFAISMFISAVLNFFVAKYFLKAEPGSVEFTRQLGWVTGWGSLSVALLVSIFLIFSIVKLFKGLRKLTGLELEEILHQHQKSN